MARQAFWLIFCVCVLFSVGVLMVFNTTSAEIIDRSLNASTHAALIRQIAYATAGVVAGRILQSLGYQWILKKSFLLLVGTTILLVFVFVPPIGQILNGARRWVGFGGFTFQPSECAKIFIPICFIRWVLMQKEPIRLKAFLRSLALLFVPIGLIFMEPDNGTTVIIFTCMIVLFVLARIRWLYWAMPLLVLFAVGAVSASRMPHVRDRIRVYLHPETDIRGKGHQPHQAKIAAGSGRLTGLGLGQGLQKLNYLPEARSDYIAAIFAEECGFLGIFGLIILYVVFMYAGFSVAMNAPDRGGFLLAAFLTFLISIQAFLNLGIVCGLLPSKGTTLPFFSQGGSSLIMNIIAFFLLLDIARHCRQSFFSGSSVQTE
jgi:cell division protein FtsW